MASVGTVTFLDNKTYIFNFIASSAESFKESKNKITEIIGELKWPAREQGSMREEIIPKQDNVVTTSIVTTTTESRVANVLPKESGQPPINDVIFEPQQIITSTTTCRGLVWEYTGEKYQCCENETLSATCEKQEQRFYYPLGTTCDYNVLDSRIISYNYHKCPACYRCEPGQDCVRTCLNNDTCCGCGDCENCNEADGWYPPRPKTINETCPNKKHEYRDYFCFNESEVEGSQKCVFRITDTLWEKSCE